MNADYPGAIVVEAANYGYSGAFSRPRAWALHTPEELADSDPQTPYYFHNTTREASTTYFVSYLGFVFQCVPESEGAYANAVEGKPYPSWADSTINLNLQTLSVEIEGFATDIHLTMPRGSPQWKALVDLMAHRCKALGIPPDRTFGHYEVSIYRGDPGQLDIPQLVADVVAKMEEDMPKLIHCIDGGKVYVVGEVGKRHIDDQAELGIYIRLFGAWMDVYQAEADMIPDVPSVTGNAVDVASIASAVANELARRMVT